MLVCAPAERVASQQRLQEAVAAQEAELQDALAEATANTVPAQRVDDANAAVALLEGEVSHMAQERDSLLAHISILEQQVGR